MDVVFPSGEIVDNSMATDKQQQKSFLAFIWARENTCCSEIKWIMKYLAMVEQQYPVCAGVQKAFVLLLSCSGCLVHMDAYVCVCILNENVSPII